MFKAVTLKVRITRSLHKYTKLGDVELCFTKCTYKKTSIYEREAHIFAAVCSFEERKRA